MNTIEFHTGIDEPAAFTQRMLRKAHGQGTRVLVTAPVAMLEQISRQLWVAYEREFVAHVMAERCRPEQRARSPIWLASSVTGAEHEPRVLINVGADVPADPVRLNRLIEVVSSDADEAAAGRQRWRYYAAAGLQLQHFKTG